MHLLATEPGTIADGKDPVDLGQTPGEVLVLSAADTEIACLAGAQKLLCGREPRWPSLRLASLLRLGHNYSVDLHVDQVAAKARLVIVRALGGRGYWPYGVERLAALAREGGPKLALLPGDDQPDAELASLSTLPPAALHRLWRYLAEGGSANAEQFLRYAASLVGRESFWREPEPLLRAGLYWPGAGIASLEDVARHWRADAPVAALVFYRALVQGANLAPVDALVAALASRGLNPLPIFAASLRDTQSAALIAEIFGRTKPEIVLNATGFAVAAPGRHEDGPFAGTDAPVLQVIFSGGGRAEWAERTRGLDARDIAMNVALPELDGRIISRAVSFKAPPQRDTLTEADLTTYEPVADRISFMADLARNWTRLRRTPAAERRIVLVLANYPNRDGRIGNGVGLDTPASVIATLHALAAAGYRVADIPDSGDALIAQLLCGPTNAAPGARSGRVFSAQRLRHVPRQPAARGAGQGQCPLGRARARSLLPCGRARLRHLRRSGAALRQHRGRDPALARLQHRPESVATTIPISCRRTPIWHFTPGSPTGCARTPSCIWASMAISNGCRGRRWRCRRTASPRRRSAPYPISIPSSSTIRAKGRRPSAARRR